jgi:hypothetical protein
MNFEIITTPYFEREAKKLLKKYPSIKDDLAALGEELSKNPTLGTPLGNQIFKIRLSITSKGKGKSGGARVITLVKVVIKTVYLISAYDKSEQENLTKEKIQELVNRLELEN